MKKKLSIILSSAFAFVLAFTLLGFSVRAAGKTDNSAQYIKAGEQVVQILAEDAEKKDGSLQSYLGMEKKKADDATISWGEMSGKFGTLTGFNEEKCSATVDDSTGSGTINIAVTGSNNRTGVVTIELAEGYIDSISCAIDDTFAESLEKAGMNTVIGLAMAFGILSLIAIIIRTVFPQIFKLSRKMEDKKAGKSAAQNTSAAAPAEAAPAKEEAAEETDDGELVAVIAAAIAASEGRATTDGFRVRSIRRHF